MRPRRLPVSAIFSLAFTLSAMAATTVSLVTDASNSPAVEHGLKKLKSALHAKGVSLHASISLENTEGHLLVVAGLAAGSGAAASLHGSSNIPRPEAPESLLLQNTRWKGKKTLLVSGGDARGLMYALLEVANRVAWATDPADPFSEVRDVTEKPAVSERALSIYTMQKAHFESRFHDEAYWAKYFDMLAENRFNSFVLIFGYEAVGYFAPAYPYFFEVEGFPEVSVAGLSREHQQRNLKMLNRLIEMAHDRGLNFTAGLWDHVYRGGVQSGGVKLNGPIPGVTVSGLNEKNLMPYHRAALAKFLQSAPHLDAVQFRMHGESGLKRDEMHAFWKGIYEVMKQQAPHVRFDARLKDFPDSLIELAVQMGVNIRLCTKYWAEQMGMPFHPTHINRQNQFDRRHGYADVLRYPQKYKMHWRLWSGGTNRVLLWGDPDWVRRFAESTHLYDGDGFEVNEPLATKMASHPHDMKPFDVLNPRYRYYEWEFERYWHFYQLFGRIGYNPDTSPEVWQREFERRFGKEAGACVEEALHLASWILPWIQAYNFPYSQFPTTRGWIEKERREDLPVYAEADPSDTEQFLSISQAALHQVEGKTSAKKWPQQTSRWLAERAEQILALVAEAEKRIGSKPNNEFISTIVDLKILANLALYHSRRIHAGLSLALFERTQDLNCLDDALVQESSAMEAWKKIADAAGDVYHSDLMMGLAGAGLAGHWRDELAELGNGLAQLQERRRKFELPVKEGMPLLAHAPVRRASPGEQLVVRATVAGAKPVVLVRIGYRTGKGEWKYAKMEPAGPWLFRGTLPAQDVTTGLKYFIEATDEAGHWVTYPPTGRIAPVALTVSNDVEPPVVQHVPIAHAPAERPLPVTVEVRDPSGVQWVRLRYRSVNQHHDYQTLEMSPTGKPDQYQVVVPAEHINPRWDFMYFVEVLDSNGNGKIYPDLEREQPYVVVRLERSGDRGQNLSTLTR